MRIVARFIRTHFVRRGLLICNWSEYITSKSLKLAYLETKSQYLTTVENKPGVDVLGVVMDCREVEVKRRRRGAATVLGTSATERRPAPAQRRGTLLRGRYL